MGSHIARIAGLLAVLVSAACAPPRSERVGGDQRPGTEGAAAERSAENEPAPGEQVAKNGLTWSVRPSLKSIYPGEPVLLIVKLSNGGQQPVTVDFGWDRVEAFSIRLRDAKGRVVAESVPVKMRGGLSRVGWLAVPAQAAVDHELVLNRWCSTLLPTGEYKVVCDIAPKGAEALQVACSLEVSKMNKAAARQRLSELADTALNGRKIKNQNLAGKMLSYADAPLAVEYQARLVWGPRSFESLGIAGLERVGNLEAAKELAEISEDPSSPDRVRTRAVLAIYRIRDRSKSREIRAATRAIVRKYPRPPEGGLRG